MIWLVAEFDSLRQCLSPPGHLTQRSCNAVKASKDFKSLADILSKHLKNVRKSRNAPEARAIVDPFVDTIKDACDAPANLKSAEFKNTLVKRKTAEIQQGHLGESGF